MALTPSNMLDLGTKAFEFSLLDTVSDQMINYSDIKGLKGTLVLFICNHCPYVIHVKDLLSDLGDYCFSRGIGIVAISSNDIEKYPDDRPELMKKVALSWRLNYPYLYDSDQSIARKYQAACTPDIYLFDSNDLLFYRGQFDSSRPNSNIPVTGKDLKSAIEIMISGGLSPENQYPSSGCNIKWITR